MLIIPKMRDQKDHSLKCITFFNMWLMQFQIWAFREGIIILIFKRHLMFISVGGFGQLQFSSCQVIESFFEIGALHEDVI